jgi:hypothetical protein
MTLAEFLTRVSKTYEREGAMSSPAQVLLRQADVYLGGYVPGGIVIRGSGGKGRGTYTPWIGFFDPDETETPEAGIYVVYLFGADLASVTLSVMQGITRLSRQLGTAAARERLALDATAIRGSMGSIDDWDSTMELASTGFRQLAYETGTIAARRYLIDSLPQDAILREDLAKSLELYQAAVRAKRHLLQARPGDVVSSSVMRETADNSQDPLAGFKPKNSDDYVAHLVGRTLIKSRRHERLIADYSHWAGEHRFKVSSEHPVDLVLRSEKSAWLVEGKVLYNGNATDAVRAALGQLYAYRHFLYRAAPAMGLLALFAEPVGDGFVSFLEDYGVGSVWKDADSWSGSPSARDAGLTGASTTRALENRATSQVDAS